jgi:hypothetical protein
MATDDRKRRILDHLSQSSRNADYIPKKPFAGIEPAPLLPEPVAPTPVPAAAPKVKAKDRKRRIMEHLSMSSKEFGEIVSTSDEEKRKRKIQEHIRESSK